MPQLQTDPKVKSSFMEFIGTVNEAGLMETSRQFSDAVQQFTTQAEKPVLHFSVYSFSKLNTDFFQKVISWITTETIDLDETKNNINITGNAIQFELDFPKFESVSSMGIGYIAPPLTFILASANDLADSSTLKDKLIALATDNFYIILITETDFQLDTALRSELQNNLLYFEQLSGVSLPEKMFYERLNEPDFINIINTIYNYASLNAIESFNSFFGLLMDQQERNLRAKKAINQQQVVKIQSKGSITVNDIINQLKNRINSEITMLEKGINDSFENLLRPQTGQFSKMIDETVAALTTLEQNKLSKTLALTIPKDFNEKYFDDIYNSFIKYGHDQLIQIRDSFKTIEKEIGNYSTANNLPPFTLNFKFLTDQQLKIILESATRNERPYEGSLSKKGIYDYLMKARQPLMMLGMLASILGVTFNRTNMSPTIFYSITFVLLGAGSFALYKSVKSENKESQEKELEKAKESLKNEARRIAAEVSRQWVKVVSDHLKMQVTQVVANIESVLKEYSSRKQAEEDDEKKRVQRQMQGLDNTERKMSNILRMRENFTRNLQRNKLDFKQSFFMVSKKWITENSRN